MFEASLNIQWMKLSWSKTYFQLLGILLGVAVLLLVIALITDSNEVGKVAFVTFLLEGAVAYFIPTAIAEARSHPNLMGVFCVNLFLGWTLIGYVVALVWALYRTPAASAPLAQAVGVQERLLTLSKLKSDGLISEEEFQQKRTAVLSSLALG